MAMLAIALLGLAPWASAAAAGPTFERDVQPVLTRAGCNAGACHGKARGQNGFQLSLLAFDPDADYGPSRPTPAAGGSSRPTPKTACCSKRRPAGSPTAAAGGSARHPRVPDGADWSWPARPGPRPTPRNWSASASPRTRGRWRPAKPSGSPSPPTTRTGRPPT